MARNIYQRLNNLKARRSGTDRLYSVRADSADELLRKSTLTEDYQKRSGADQPNTRYALGSMQEVSPDYTRISIETAQRVGNQLQQGLTRAGFSVEFRLQGSVPLNTHIRGVSDVDLLNLDTGLLTYMVAGARARAGWYTSPTARTSVEALSALRRESERILRRAYPAVTVDTSGAKAIHLSGGSLARPVDVVPSHWVDTIAFQSSGQEHDRGVRILDKDVPTTIDNLPFLHIKRVTEQDTATLGGLKKAIRLVKNVKSDAEEDGRNIALGSYDIAAMLFHADATALRGGYVYELAVLAETQRYMDWLYHNPLEAQKLVVPDGSRKVFDSAEKFSALLALSVEMDELTREVAKEQSERLRYGTPTLDASRAAVSQLYIPAAG
jgi:hypothetical protein